MMTVLYNNGLAKEYNYKIIIKFRSIIIMQLNSLNCNNSKYKMLQTYATSQYLIYRINILIIWKLNTYYTYYSKVKK